MTDSPEKTGIPPRALNDLFVQKVENEEQRSRVGDMLRNYVVDKLNKWLPELPIVVPEALFEQVADVITMHVTMEVGGIFVKEEKSWKKQDLLTFDVPVTRLIDEVLYSALKKKGIKIN